MGTERRAARRIPRVGRVEERGARRRHARIHRRFQTITEDVLDVTAIAELRGIAEEPEYWRIGPLTTWSDLVAARLPAMFDGYKRAAREVGGLQIQNAGTLAGNLCNASPAADSVPALVAASAKAVIAGPSGKRTIPVEAVPGPAKVN